MFSAWPGGGGGRSRHAKPSRLEPPQLVAPRARWLRPRAPRDAMPESALSHRSLAFREAYLKADEERFHAGRWTRDSAAGKIIFGLQADLLYRSCCEQGGLFKPNGCLDAKRRCSRCELVPVGDVAPGPSWATAGPVPGRAVRVGCWVLVLWFVRMPPAGMFSRRPARARGCSPPATAAALLAAAEPLLTDLHASRRRPARPPAGRGRGHRATERGWSMRGGAATTRWFGTASRASSESRICPARASPLPKTCFCIGPRPPADRTPPLAGRIPPGREPARPPCPPPARSPACPAAAGNS